MRKYAGKCVALFMALLMLLTSMPLTALADSITSDAWSYTADPQPADQGGATNASGLPTSAYEAAKNAADTAPGSYIFAADGGTDASSAVPTGADFGYSVFLYYKQAPRYLDANTGGEEAAFSAYKNITVKVKPPQGVVLVGEGSADSDGYYTVHTIAEQHVQGDGNLRIHFTARMTGNGTTPGNQTYNGFDVKVEATVDTFNDGSTGEPLTFASTYHANVSVTNTASNTWGVQKQFVKAEQTPADDGTPTVTLTWTVKAGKMSGEKLFANDKDYDVPGTLNFKSYKFTDTLPVIESVEGEKYAPLSATISADGTVQATTGQGDTTISTNFVKTTPLTAGGVDTTTPLYTEYTITATYAREAFVTPYEKNDEDVNFTNGAKIEYTLVDGTTPTPPDASAAGKYSIDSPAGSLKIEEYIKLGSAEKTPYDAILAQAFPGPATFNVYKLTGEDDTKGTLVNTNAPIEIRGGSDPTHTLTDLEPGWYRVQQVNRPSGTDEVADVTVEVKSDETAKAPFVNPVPGQGVLKIKKVNESGAALADAKFTLTGPNGSEYTLTTLADGVAVLALPVGTYTMRETAAPNGYVLSTQTWEITIEEGKTNETYFTTPIVNIANTGTLTIHKKLTDGVDTKDPSEAMLGSTFSFTIGRYTMVDGEEQYDESYNGSATIAANANSTTVSGLAKADADGNYYTYEVTEVTETTGGDAWLTYDTSTRTADFNSATEDVDEAVTFTNTVKSTLTISKTLKDIDHPNGTHMQASFDVYKDSASGTRVATITTDATTTGKGTAVDPTTKETIYLPIAENGAKINYYIVETKADGYDVTYPDGGNTSWQVNLAFGKATELSTAVVNTKQEAQITITKQDNDNKAVSGATFAVKNSDGQYLIASADGKTYNTTADITEATPFTTGPNGSVAVKYLPLDTYTIVETSVPAGLLSTGSVSGKGVNSVATETVNGETALAGSIALNASLQSAAITFKNDVEPRFTVTKSVKTTAGTAASVSGTFTFELYEDTDGKPGEAVRDAAGNVISVFVTLNSASSATSAAVTVPGGDGTYWLKETDWPNAVMDPALTAVEGDTTKIVEDAVYTKITLEKNETATATIANTINGGTVTITKIDSKTENADGTGKVLPGAKFQLQVSGVTDARAQAQLTALGFTAGENNTYTKEYTTNENGQIVQSGLPVYNGNDTTPLIYYAKETLAPTGYVAVPADAQFTALPELKKDDNGNWATAETFENDPLAELSGEKTWTKQWETDSKNPITYKLAGVQLAVFEVGEDDALAHVQTVTTDANGAYTVENLNGTKEYVVFELKGNANKNLEGVPTGTAGTDFAASEEDIKNLNKTVALGKYYGVAINLADDPDNAGEVDLVNVEPYVQLTLYKWYYPEDDTGKDIEPKVKTPLDRAKFVLCRTTDGAPLTSEVNFAKGGFDKASLITALRSAGVLVSEYVYESGMSDMLPTGYLVTGPLPRTDDEGKPYTYYFVEIESPSGFADPVWPDNISEGITPEPGKTNVLTDMENDPKQQGPGTIRYVQVEIDKRVENENGRTRPLSNATFSLYLVLKGEDAEKHGELYHISTFTSGVDTTKPIPGVEGKPEGAYDPGRGISESFALNELREDFEKSVTVDGTEYTADFVLIETEWPGNTTPTQYRYNFTITTNGDHDALEDDEDATLYNYYTIEGGSPIINLETEKVTVVFKKIGYEADATVEKETSPLAGAQISIYDNKERTGEPVARGTTNEKGEVTFTLSYGTTFYWKETGIPTGYEAVAPGDNRFATEMNADYSFTTPQYSSSLTQPDEGGGTSLSEPIVTVENVRYRKLALTKKDASENNVATFELRKSDGSAVEFYTLNANGQFVSATSVTAKTDGTPVEVYVPAGTYTLVETHLNGTPLSETEQTYFNWLNSNGANAVTITLTGQYRRRNEESRQPRQGRAPRPEDV